ncbi:C40 family peptidase [Altericista sp. CCNU0014]|uniref:C40 family peptidase n=1 Tax=Altericista sp. CCNU0014 TaxID=3082949 RepID=UPI00384EEA25
MIAFDARHIFDASRQGIAYEAIRPLNLYDSPALNALATQAQAGRQLRFQSVGAAEEGVALPMVLCEDDYPGWMGRSDLAALQPATAAYVPSSLSLAEIQARIPLAIAFARAAMAQPNCYLWGGTLGPNYDCSGLVQHAFSTQGIWLPRDAYQQEAFVERIENPGDRPEALVDVLELGDLIFFGTPLKATHVAIYLGGGDYIHSSGKDRGRNGIGIDSLVDLKETVSQNYYAQIRGAGRVVRSYAPRSLS